MLRKKLIRRFASRHELSAAKSTPSPKPEGDFGERSPSKERGVPRFEVRLVASVELGESSYVGFTENVSHAGVFVATQAPQTVGATVNLLIALPDLALVRAEGTVRWIRPGSKADGVSAGLGIHFEKLSALDTVRIHDFVRARQSTLLDRTNGRRGTSA